MPDPAINGVITQQYFATGAVRAWKSFDWTAMNRLHEKGLIDNPVSKAKSVWLTDEGLRRAEVLVQKLFARAEATSDKA
jgi:hypothetical protein